MLPHQFRPDCIMLSHSLPLTTFIIRQIGVWPIEHINQPHNSAGALMLQRLAKLGYDATQFNMHSFRAGGATAAANAGVPDRLFNRHGRWNSESAKDGYVKDSVEPVSVSLRA